MRDAAHSHVLSVGRTRRGCDLVTAIMQTLLQDEAELTEFIELLKSEDVRSYLEIGAHYGGCLQRVGMALRPRAKLVAVNLQSDARPRPPSYISLEKCIGDMRRLGHEAHLVWGDSTDADVV